MRRDGIVKLTVVCVIATLMFGCALFGGPTDEESITGQLETWKTSLESQDLDRIMAVYSTDYKGRRGAGKEELRERMERIIDGGYLLDREINLTEAVINVDGETAVAGPIEMTTSRGPWRFNFEFKKDADGQWRIVGRRRAEEDSN